MLFLLKLILWTVRLLARSQQALVLENLALRPSPLPSSPGTDARFVRTGDTSPASKVAADRRRSAGNDHAHGEGEPLGRTADPRSQRTTNAARSDGLLRCMS